MRNDAILVSGNAGSWALTCFAAVSLADIGTMVGIAAGLGSLAVSIASIWWIKKQAKNSDNK